MVPWPCSRICDGHGGTVPREPLQAGAQDPDRPLTPVYGAVGDAEVNRGLPLAPIPSKVQAQRKFAAASSGTSASSLNRSFQRLLLFPLANEAVGLSHTVLHRILPGRRSVSRAGLGFPSSAAEESLLGPARSPLARGPWPRGSPTLLGPPRRSRPASRSSSVSGKVSSILLTASLSLTYRASPPGTYMGHPTQATR